MSRDTIGPGAAAVHIVCADLLLSGRLAFIAPEGCHYDVVLESPEGLLRVQVKSTRARRGRSSRPAAMPVYQFGTDRGHRPEGGERKSIIKRYSDAEVDLFACVALDIRQVAYFPVLGRFVSGIHLFPPGTEPWIRNGVNQRRCIDEYPVAPALLALKLGKASLTNTPAGIEAAAE